MKIDFSKLPKIEKTGIAVDIDETLSWTVGYWMEEMQKLFGNPENLTIEEMVNKYTYTQNVPYWQTKEALDWIEEKKHSNEVKRNLPLIANANTYLNKIDKILPIAVYLTIRPETVAKGTKEWLDKHNFPKAPIIFKPKDVSNKDAYGWKARVLEKLYPQINSVIDDNDLLIKELNKNYKGKIFLYDHDKVNSSLNVIACKDWDKVYKEIKNNLI